MRSLSTLSDLPALLIDLVRLLGIESVNWSANEKLDELRLASGSVPIERIKGLPPEILPRLRTSFGSTLSLKVGIGGDLRELLNPQPPDNWLSDFAGEQLLRMELYLNKTKLLELYDIHHVNAAIKLFLFAERLIQDFNAPIADLEKWFKTTGADNSKLIILVPGHDIVLNGKYLSVIGHLAIAHWKDYVPQTPPDPSPVNMMHEKAIQTLNWVNFDLDILTPLQLLVSPISQHGSAQPIASGDPLALAVYKKLVDLSIIYTASRTIAPKSKPAGQTDSGWTAVYGSESDRAEVELGTASAFASALADNRLLALSRDQTVWDLPHTLGEMAGWAYEGERDQILNSSDRLYALQGVIAHRLLSGTAQSNYLSLIQRASDHRKDVESGYTSFVRKKLEEYFSRVRDVEKAVDELIKGVNDEVQSLIKSLTDSMLAAVGVIIGTFLAAVFAKDFNATIFRIGLGAYIIYLVCFPGLVTLTATRQRYQHLLQMFNGRKEAFSSRLSKGQVDEIIEKSPVDEKKRWFTRWFDATIAIYIIVVILLAFSFFAVPGVISSAASAAAAAPAPTIAPTITPIP